jgi:sugar phosphate isomerase/epimerase
LCKETNPQDAKPAVVPIQLGTYRGNSLMHRRTFLSRSLSAAACATAAFAFPSRALALPPENVYLKNLGLQIYTVRNQLEKDRAGTIAKIAESGYQQIELMDVLKDKPLVELANDHGMSVTSGFFDWKTVVSPDEDGVAKIDDIIAAAKDYGLKHLVFGYIGKGHRETADHYRRIADSANAIGEKIRDAGMKMNYHNHSFEFKNVEDDKMGFEIFIERFQPSVVDFELDVFWAAIGGWNPLQILKRLDKRAVQLHLKDIRPGTGTIFDEGKVPEIAFQEVGDGSIMFREILALAEQLGVEQCHVEQDQSPSPLDSIYQSMQYLKDMDPA